MLRWTGGLVMAFGAAMGVVRFAGRSPAESVPEAALSSLAFAALIAAPGVLTVLAERHPSLLAAVGAVLVPLSMLSFAGVLLPLLIPAVLAFVSYARRRKTESPPFQPAVVMLVCLTAAVMALFAHADPREYSTPAESGGTSDVVTWWESLMCLSLVGVGIALAQALSRPVPRPTG